MSKKFLLLGAVTGMAFVATVNAQPFLTGTMSASEFGSNGSTYTSTSFTLDSMNNVITKSKTGDFLTQVPAKSDLTAYSLTLGGIGTTPTPESIPDFFVFSSPDPDIVGSTGTTPINRFDFNLSSIQYLGNGLFSGTGTIIDTAVSGAFAPTPGNFTLSFSSPLGAPLDQGSYSLTLNAVPEPATISLFGIGLLGAWAFRRRKA